MDVNKPLTRADVERKAERLRIDARLAYLAGHSVYAKRLDRRAVTLARSIREVAR
jgi:hypothetical protein